MKKIAIRADGNSAIGFGHLIRTQALAHQLEKLGAELVFFSRNPENIKGFAAVELTADSMEDEDRLVISCLRKYDIDMLIIDSYNYNQNRLDLMGELAAATVYIDDTNFCLFNTTFVANGNLYAPRLDYRGRAQFLLGSDYLMMRDDFSGIGKRTVRPKVEDILLTFGAADTENITPALLKLLIDYHRFKAIRWHIVVGPAFRNSDEIEYLARTRDNMLVYYSPAMKDLMDRCDIAVSAAGSTTYELAACGIPAVLLVVADNQLMLAEEADRQQIAINLGWCHRLNKNVLYGALDKLIGDSVVRQTITDRGQAVIDGRGTERLAKLLISYDGGNC